MDKFATQSAAERKPYFETAAANAGNISAYIMEKDFWVCWTLKRLFSMATLTDHLIFKGGTSLSKVFGVIERFSEDIDISISKEFLGFGGDNDPEKAGGSNKVKAKIQELGEACSKYVNTQLLADLQKEIERALGTADGWKLEPDPGDKDKQTLLFVYPPTGAKASGYIKPWVKIEMGARSDHWPAHQYTLQPYLALHVKDSLESPDVDLKAMDAKRTFWEKATILHSFVHLPEDKAIGERQSRHYYDFYRLLHTEHAKAAVAELDLLTRVATHKSVYFRAGWAKYEEAKKGTLGLMPGKRVEEFMRQDYGQMQEMIFGEVPAWADILAAIKEFEDEFNS